MLSNWIFIYISIGVVCGFCFDILYRELDMEPATNFERVFWFIAWPFFILMFLYGIFNNDDNDDMGD